MHEQESSGGAPREQQLASILASDFRMPEDSEPVPEGDALAAFLRHVQPVEEIDARFESDENAQLGETVAALLEPAPVTDAFKAVIAHEVRAAHAWHAQVNDTVAPDRLGLLSGPGLFDSAQAQEIEMQALRGYLFDVIHNYTDRPDSDDEAPLSTKPGVRPQDYIEAMGRLERWFVDFRTTYDADPFDGIDPEAYRAAASEVHVLTEEEAAELGFDALAKRLSELTDEE